MMRWLLITVIVTLLGGIAATILWIIGVSGAGAIAFVLGVLALASGFTVVTGPLEGWGGPNDEPWPTLRGRKR